MIDKFEEDQPQFTTPRSYIRYLFNRTKGDANKHLYPRYTSEESNRNPYTDYREMFKTLDSIYLNPFQTRDARNQYRELRMSTRQSFHEFKTQFLHLANEAQVPEADRFHDLYDKLTAPLQRQILNQLPTMAEKFETLCTFALSIDSELKRLNTRVLREKEAAAAADQQAKVPNRRSRPNPQNRPTTPPAPSASKPANQESNPSFGILQHIGTLNPTQSSEPKCYNCGGVGHFIAKCPFPQRAADVKDIESDELGDLGDYHHAVYQAEGEQNQGNEEA